MRGTVRPELVRLRGAAIGDLRKIDAAFDSKSASNRQVLDADGHRLPRARSRVVGGPSLATSSVWRWAVDRWAP